MGEKEKCEDCSHFHDLTGCIHVDGTDNIDTCEHFDSWLGEEVMDTMFPECAASKHNPPH